MAAFGAYTCCIVQPIVRFVYKRDEIAENTGRYLKLIDNVARRFGSPLSPLKLICFPEFFIQGFTTRLDVDMDFYEREILITIPGRETDRLAEKARELDIYILGCALEHDPKFPGYFFNTAFIISPAGDVIHKYRKSFTAIHAEMAMSPHDILDQYMEVCGQGKSVVDTVFPVAKTEIGGIGTFTCMDGHFPEVTRALAMRGAEILVRPTAFPEPLVSPPMNTWELQNRVRAHENMAYVVAPNTGGLITDELPQNFTPGDSMIVDFNGVIAARAPYAGETVVCGEINLDGLRRRRQDPRRNFLTQIRTELFRELYDETIYPANRYRDDPLVNRRDLARRSTSDIIRAMVESGRLTPPGV